MISRLAVALFLAANVVAFAWFWIAHRNAGEGLGAIVPLVVYSMWLIFSALVGLIWLLAARSRTNRLKTGTGFGGRHNWLAAGSHIIAVSCILLLLAFLLRLNGLV